MSNKFHTTLFADDTTFSLSDDNYDTMVTTLNSELTIKLRIGLMLTD